MDDLRQKESGRRLFLAGALALCWLPGLALADGNLDAGGMTFRDFAVLDNGASFNRGDPMIAGGPNQVSSRVMAIDTANSLARVRFDAIRVEVALPLGWQATEDWLETQNVDPPYWAFCWPGGQAVARYLLLERLGFSSSH